MHLKKVSIVDINNVKLSNKVTHIYTIFSYVTAWVLYRLKQNVQIDTKLSSKSLHIHYVEYYETYSRSVSNKKKGY